TNLPISASLLARSEQPNSMTLNSDIFMNTENRNLETEQMKVVVSPSPTASDAGGPQAKASRRGRYFVVGAVAASLIAGLITGVVPRLRAQNRLAASVEDNTHPTVIVTNATRVSRSLD